MNRFFSYTTASIFLLITTSVFSQGISDVIRYSEYTPLGTARTVGVGSSFGAMGGDFSVIGINPAGIAVYRKSEFVLTPSIGATSADAYLSGRPGESRSASRTRFGVDNIGLVTASRPLSSTWTTSNFAIGLSKLKDFGREFTYSGANSGSIAENWAVAANNGEFSTDVDLADQAGAIFVNAQDNFQADAIPEHEVNKSETVIQRGHINELSVAWAGSYKNAFDLGISIGIPFVSFEETKEYEESITAPTENSPLLSNELLYSQYLNTTGTGINLKIGAIYKVKKLRIAAALHSPTWYALNDDFNSSLQYSYSLPQESMTSDLILSPDNFFSYGFTSPWRVIGSLGSIYSIGKAKGFVNADLEYLDYTSANLNFTRDSRDIDEIEAGMAANEEIDQQLGTATIVRLGTEIAYPLGNNTGLRLRFGYLFVGSPLRDDGSVTSSWSSGFGLRFERHFVDFGYRLTTTTEDYRSFPAPDLSRDPLTQIDTNRGRMVMTLGFKF